MRAGWEEDTVCTKSDVTEFQTLKVNSYINRKTKVTGRSENLWLEVSQGCGEGSM